jgi:hypothetical protein
MSLLGFSTRAILHGGDFPCNHHNDIAWNSVVVSKIIASDVNQAVGMDSSPEALRCAPSFEVACIWFADNNVPSQVG